MSLLHVLGLLVNATLVICMLYRLRAAKVNGTNSGHLNMCNAKLLLVFIFLQIISALLPTFTEVNASNMYLDMIDDILNLCLTTMYFKMITNFITQFTLKTKVSEDGTIDIVGIDPNGFEVFKFALDNELREQWLGTAKLTKSATNVKDSQTQPVIRNRGRQVDHDDVTDDSDVTSPTNSNFDVVSAFQGYK